MLVTNVVDVGAGVVVAGARVLVVTGARVVVAVVTGIGVLVVGTGVGVRLRLPQPLKGEEAPKANKANKLKAVQLEIFAIAIAGWCD